MTVELKALFSGKVVIRMDEKERISERIERQNELISKIEAGMDGVPDLGKNGQLVVLQLLKSELASFEQALIN
jgi:hypothetical protein